MLDDEKSKWLVKEQIIINKTDKPNSYEFGKAGDRWKLYFNDAEDLEKQINALTKLGLYKKNETNNN